MTDVLGSGEAFCDLDCYRFVTEDVLECSIPCLLETKRPD